MEDRIKKLEKEMLAMEVLVDYLQDALEFVIDKMTDKMTANEIDEFSYGYLEIALEFGNNIDKLGL